MYEFLTWVTAGILASIVMSLTMMTIHNKRLANADMVRAIGSLITRQLHNALATGLVIHLVFGAAFAVLYGYIWHSMGVESLSAFVATGAFMGFGHGLIVSIGLVISVAEYHPLLQFRQAGFSVAVAYILGHVVYGSSLGLIVGSLLL